MTTQAKHTPGKLRVHPDLERFPFVIQNDAGQHIAETGHAVYIDPAEHRANAARLAHCWNQHDALVAALRTVLTHAEQYLEFGKVGGKEAEILEQARAVLSAELGN